MVEEAKDSDNAEEEVTTSFKKLKIAKNPDHPHSIRETENKRKGGSNSENSEDDKLKK